MQVHGLVVALIVLLAGLAGLPAVAEPDSVKPLLGEADLGLRRPAQVASFYNARDGRRAWTPSRIAELRAAIAGAEDHGLPPGGYHDQALQDPALSAARRDVLATDAFLTLGDHMLHGKVDPRSIEVTWNTPPKERDLVAVLTAAIEAGSIGGTLDDLQPDAPVYQVLRRALAMYADASREGHWPQVPPGETRKLGMSGDRVAALRMRLRATGLLSGEPKTDDATFDHATEQAAATFQRRVGLEPDGIVGRAPWRN